MSSLTLKTLLGGSIIKNTLNSLGYVPRRFTTICGEKLVYSEYGDPLKVIIKKEEIIDNIEDDEVLVKMLAAPVNPADVNTIQGKYPSRPTLPAVPGNEGIGEVIEVGCNVTDLCVGDRVVPLTNMLGTWRTHIVIDACQALKVPNQLPLVEAATLTVNPCTAYRMLKDFVCLKDGDVVIQNGANSACGQNVIQLARIWGFRTVNIIRDRPNIDVLKTHLKRLGATEVLTEEELRVTDLFKAKKLPKPKLGLNCVGGKSALEIIRHLEHSAPIVTYGGMSKEPVTITTSALIFKNIQVRGFWMTEWTKQNATAPERQDMFNEIICNMINKRLEGPASKMVAFDDYKEALMNTMTVKGMVGLKYILSSVCKE